MSLAQDIFLNIILKFLRDLHLSIQVTRQKSTGNSWDFGDVNVLRSTGLEFLVFFRLRILHHFFAKKSQVCMFACFGNHDEDVQKCILSEIFHQTTYVFFQSPLLI